MSEQEREQQSEETAEEREETMQDLDLPAEEGEDVTGGTKYSDVGYLKRG